MDRLSLSFTREMNWRRKTVHLHKLTLNLMVETTPTGIFGYLNTIDENGQWNSSSILSVTESESIWQIKTSTGTLEINDVQDVGIEDPLSILHLGTHVGTAILSSTLHQMAKDTVFGKTNLL